MNDYMNKYMPSFIEKEIKNITDTVKPQLKRSTRYTLFAVPLIAFSTINLILLLISGGWNLDNMLILSIYSLVAAVGFALFKESKHAKKEMRQIGMKHIIERIHKSEHVNEHSKEEYINTVKSQPKFSLQTFLNFLKEEDERKQSMMEN